ncbi:MAG: hypothetical protein ACRBF0_18710 [Calditrichia bacterium]
MPKALALLFPLLLLTQLIYGQKTQIITANDSLRNLKIPARSSIALEGSAFAAQVWDWNIEEREKAVVKEILSGNVPSFSRKLKAIMVNETIGDNSFEVTIFAICDYLAIGSDEDYFYIPMTPATAQYLADRLSCTLPTSKMVNLIYNNAELKLKPQPIAPSDTMTTVPVFWQHTDSIKQQFSQLALDRSANSIVGGTKKDIIISNKIYSPERKFERVVIYGWHLSVDDPIQPPYNGHGAMYADYSHGVRLIANTVIVNGDSVRVKDILSDAILWPLLSDEGVISQPRYPPGD